MDTLCRFRPFTGRQRRLIWRNEPNPHVKVNDILRAVDSGNALWVRKVDDRGVVVKRIGKIGAKAGDPRGECFLVTSRA